MRSSRHLGSVTGWVIARSSIIDASNASCLPNGIVRAEPDPGFIAIAGPQGWTPRSGSSVVHRSAEVRGMLEVSSYSDIGASPRQWSACGPT